jgi:hypothetical protein
MNDLYRRAVYYPVNPMADIRAFELTSTALVNATVSINHRLLQALWLKDVICDSGGMQVVTKGLWKNIPVFIGSMFKTTEGDPGAFFIGTYNNCRIYAERNARLAFNVDIPPYGSDSDAEYYRKACKSIEAKNNMFDLAKYVCPKTEMGIVLQTRHPREISDYFGLIATPGIETYAIVVASRTKPLHALGNAYMMSFLHDIGVRRIHLLGSSSVSVIVLIAQAIALNMFNGCTFDSRSWNVLSTAGGLKSINPENLTHIQKKHFLAPNSNLWSDLQQFEEFASRIVKLFDPPAPLTASEWTGICNIEAINYFKDKMLDMGEKHTLSEFIIRRFPEKQSVKLLDAMTLLEESVKFGHGFVKNRYRSIK